MVVKRPLISDTGEGSAVYRNCSGLPGDRAYAVNIIVLLTRWS